MGNSKNNNAIITGASRGIGLAIALELADMGYNLGMISRSEQEILAAANKIKEYYPDTKIITDNFDVSDFDKVNAFVQNFSKESGEVSVLVNNAGTYITGTSGLEFEDMKNLMNVNFLSSVCFTNAVTPYMKKSQSGYIFNIASICGVEAYAGVGGYSASKFAMVGYSNSLAQELDSYGIKVTAVCPSWVNTKMASSASIKPEDMIQTSDITATIRYLLNLGKSAFVREVIIHSK